MKLSEIAAIIGAECSADVEIKSLCYDSRKATEGSLFFCLVGAEADGHNYATRAVANGAAAIVVQHKLADIDVPQLQVENTRRMLAFAAEHFYGYPHKKLKMIGLTGTNGKTTTTHLIRQVLEKYGQKTGLIGTNHILIGTEVIPAVNTTPESLEISNYLARMVEAGCVNCVMEVSSHGLKEGRVGALRYDIGAFTNLTQDHLDYHHDFADYLGAKQILFRSLDDNSVAVINGDDSYCKDFLAVTNSGTCYTYGIEGCRDFKALNIEMTGDGTKFDLLFKSKTYHVEMPLLGKFNVYNALNTMAVLYSLGIPLEFIVNCLSEAEQVRGRFQYVESPCGPHVIIDYAHSPDGLENILRTAAAIKKKRVILVFGCGGDRDKKKRPIMGEIGGRLSDFAVVTSDNPRTEDPYGILAMVEEGIKGTGTPYIVVEDRREAIRKAVLMGEEGDLVVIAGKGHEDYQIIGKVKTHFDDFEEAEAALSLWQEQHK